MKNKLTIIISLSLVLMPGLTMCKVNFPLGGTRGSGNVIEQSRDVQSFSAIEVSGGIDVYLTQADEQKVISVTDDNIQPLLMTKVEGNTLKIFLKESVSNTKELKVKITFKDLKDISLSGSSDLFCEEPVIFGNLNLNASGSSDVKLNLKAVELNISASGASDINLKGATGYLNLSVSGASDCKAYDLTAAKAKISTSGASDVYVTVDQSIKASASGGSDIKYRGNASQVEIDSSGGADITKE